MGTRSFQNIASQRREFFTQESKTSSKEWRPTDKNPGPEFHKILEQEQHSVLKVETIEKQIPSHHSLPAVFGRTQSTARPQERSPVEDIDTGSGYFPDFGSAAAHSAVLSQVLQGLSSSIAMDSMRYQSIPFEQGFYILDRETGKTWFTEAGSRQMVTCTDANGAKNTSSQQLMEPEPRIDTAHDVPGEPNYSYQTTSSEVVPFRNTDIVEPFLDPLEGVKDPTPRFSSTNLQVASAPAAAFHFSPVETGEHLTPLPRFTEAKEPSVYTPWHETVIQSYPYPIAHLYRTFLAEEDPRLRLRLLVLVYHQTLKYAAYPLVLQFLQDPLLNDIATYQALSRIQSSSWGAWLDFLRCANESMEEHATPLTRSVLQSYRRLEVERPLEDRFLYTQRFLDPMGEERVTYLQLGLLEAMTLFRDSFVHGFTPTVQQAEEDLRVYEPLLSEILQEMHWMVDYPLYYTWKRRDDGYHLAIPLMGYQPDIDAPHIEVPAEQLPLERPSMFLRGPENPVSLLSLFPLLLADDVLTNEPTLPDLNHALYLFDGSSGAQLIHHSLWQTPSLRDTGISWWREHLRNKRFSTHRQDFSTQQIFQQTTRWTLCQLERLTLHQQFFPELVVSRSSMERWLQDFLVSECLLFVLHGGSGVGKTTLLAQLSQQRLAEEQPVVWLSGAELLSQGLMEVLAQVVGLGVSKGVPQPEGIARCLTPHLSQEKPLLVILDNIDSLQNLTPLLGELDAAIAAFATTSLHDRIKFVVSLQSDRFWELQTKAKLFENSRKHAMTFEDSHLQLRDSLLGCELPPFGKEELEWAYSRYRSFDNGHGIEPFSPQTEWIELTETSSTRHLMRYPQLLRIALATFCGQPLPADLEVESLMENLVIHVVEERYAPLPIPERLQFLWSLSELFIQNKTDYLSREQLLLSGCPQIVRALQNPHSDSPLVQLLHLGILSEAWINGECWIQLSSPLVHSYFLAQTWIEQTSLRGPSFMMPTPEGQTLPFPLTRSYLFVWLHLIQTEHLPFFSSWVHEYFDVLESRIEEFLLFSIRIKSDRWLAFVTELLADPSESLYQCLLRVADRLWNSNDESEALDLLENLTLHNAKLGHVEHLQPEILYRRARLCEVSGRKEEAFEIYKEAKQLAEDIGNQPMLSQIFVRLSSLSRSFKRLDEAMNWLELAQEQLEEKNHPRRLARVIRQQGNLAYEQSDLSRALICYQHSLRIDENCGNTRGMAASLSNLGTVFGARGDFENALSHYYRCLHVHQRLGDRKSMATTLNNIGIILKSQRDNDEAVQVFTQALHLRKSLGLFRDSIASIHHIAVIREQQGNVEEALNFLQDCLGLQRQYDDTAGEVDTLLRMGHMLHRHGRMKEALEYFRAVRDSAHASEQSRSKAEALYAMGQLRWEWGSLDSALEAYEEAEDLLKDSEHFDFLAVLARSTAVALIENGQLKNAEQKLEQALQWAESCFQPQERFECMVEWSHLCLLEKREGAAKALIDRVESLQEDIQSPLSAKDLMCLRVRLACREGLSDDVAMWLDELQELLQTIPQDESFTRTAWALYEASRFLQQSDPFQAKRLAYEVEEIVTDRSFSIRGSLEELLHELTNSTINYAITEPSPHTETFSSVELNTLESLSETGNHSQ